MSARAIHRVAAALLVSLAASCALVAGIEAPRPASCDNGKQDQGESDVDCGGPCAACLDADCSTDSDCASLLCVDRTCVTLDHPGACDGRPERCQPCHACGPGDACVRDLDCKSGLCMDGVCAACSASTPCHDKGTCHEGRCLEVTCDNGIKDADETDYDCGGGCSLIMLGCNDEAPCKIDGDCREGLVCIDDVCVPAHCRNQTQDGDETGVDCGGDCKPCAVGEGCEYDADCETKACVQEICRAADCTDDPASCAMPGCGACVGAPCQTELDCQSVCCGADGTCCAIGCNDGIFDYDETDIDCGGPCSPCPLDRNCVVDEDCLSGNCAASKCAPPLCNNNQQDPGETDVDCGGPVCGKCGLGKSCNGPSDCKSNLCVVGKCG
jgi:hypothetical protein